MVQQGYHKGGARYSARAATRKGRAAAGEDAAYPAGRATVQAGLRSYGLNKAEQLRFAHCAPEYREARCAPALQRRVLRQARLPAPPAFGGSLGGAASPAPFPRLLWAHPAQHTRDLRQPLQQKPAWCSGCPCSCFSWHASHASPRPALATPCRNIVLGKWDADITRFLTEDECAGGLPVAAVLHLTSRPLKSSCRRRRSAARILHTSFHPTPLLPQPRLRRAGRPWCAPHTPSCSARAPSTLGCCGVTRAFRCRLSWRRGWRLRLERPPRRRRRATRRWRRSCTTS
jgi:hypothetical protein